MVLSFFATSVTKNSPEILTQPMVLPPGCLLPVFFSHLSTQKIVWLSNHAKIHKTMGRY